MSYILIVDDDPINRRIAEVALRDAGCMTACAKTGIEALIMLRDTCCELVLLDLRMPKQDGITTLRLIRENPLLAEIGVIICTSDRESSSVSHAVSLGADDYLVRPFTAAELVRRVMNIIARVTRRQLQRLAPLQSEALRVTVSTLSHAFDLASHGQPLPFHDIRRNCLAMAEAIRDDHVNGILVGLKDHDGYTFVHSIRTGVYLSALAYAMGYTGEDFLSVVAGGIIHDIGKVRIPASILSKAGPLTDDEWRIMRTHPVHTRAILTATEGIPPEIIEIGASHHEKMDGTGYPDGIPAGQLSDLARMAAIADAFCALTDKRSYKPAFSRMDALDRLRQPPGHLDQALVARFRELLLDTANSLNS